MPDDTELKLRNLKTALHRADDALQAAEQALAERGVELKEITRERARIVQTLKDAQ